jgi:hypothetical protein
MADQRGGYRKPTNPAPVSGPGALSQRTDGQPARYAAGMAYGDGQDFYELQTQAPMSGGQSAPASLPLNQGSALADYAKEVLPFDAPTQYPDQPMTTGLRTGEGAGPEILSTPAMVAAQNSEDVARLMAVLPIYARIAESPNASNSMRNFYRYLRSQV